MPLPFFTPGRTPDQYIRAWLPALLHRWPGVAASLFVALWCLSGLVMSVVAFPALDAHERRAGLPPVHSADVAVAPAEALALAGVYNFPRRMWLESLASADPRPEPVWRMVMADGSHHTVSASRGQRIDAVSPARAEAIARSFAAVPHARHIDTLERDLWTAAPALDPLRPFHRIALDDDAGTELHVSARSGETVQITTRRERLWNLSGAIAHGALLIVRHEPDSAWRQAALWLSALCALAALGGLVAALRGRCPPEPGRRPARVHRMTGLIAGLPLLVWAVSGWLALSPGDWLRSTGPGKAAMARYTGQVAPQFPWPDRMQDLDALFAEADWKEVQIYWLRGHARMTLIDGNGFRRALDMPTRAHPDVTEHHAEAVARALLPDARLAAIERLVRSDAWWYGPHDALPLPVWRVKMEDSAETWVHIDALDGRMIGTLDRDARLRRWLFDAAHGFDLPAFAEHPVLRVWLVRAFALLGLIVACSGLLIAVRTAPAPAGQQTDRTPAAPPH